MKLRTNMLTSTVIPVAIALGVAGVATVTLNPAGMARAANPCAAKNPCNPCAAKRPCNPCAAKNPCNPCAAKNPCNPCAAANPCNPCNPCAGAGSAYSSNCVVPRLQAAAAANPCAAKRPCGPCSPCAAKKPCGPCGASAANPCAAKSPCNPCAAKNPCNPCAAKNPCNPCAAANPCNPCNPCAAAAPVELSEAEAKAAYDCIIGEMRAAYAKSGLAVATDYAGWKNYSRVAYSSATHGSRFVSNYANAAGQDYGKYEQSGPMPEGTYLVKDSFLVSPDGKVGVGPLFIMRKMSSGWHADSGDWKYAMVMPNGSYFGETKGRNAANMTFCHECHMTVAEEQDSMFYLPEEFRLK